MSIYYDWALAAVGQDARLEADDAVIDALIRTNGDRYRRSPPLRVALFDLLSDPGGAVETVFHGTDARDAILAEPARWSRTLPEGVKVVKQVVLAG